MRFPDRLVPGWVGKLLVPADDRPPLAGTLFQCAGLDGLRARLTPLAPGGAEGMQLACTQSVLQAELNGVKIELASDLFHLALYSPIALRHTIATVGACRGVVCIDDIRVETDI